MSLESLSLDFILGGIVATGLLVYLGYALLRPERF
jgi:K+-transporting ATPase KdpF subunit